MNIPYRLKCHTMLSDQNITVSAFVHRRNQISLDLMSQISLHRYRPTQFKACKLVIDG